ncbi:MAG TPA: GWxTD domain-containing protein, partial [Candidatus Angelobacter sp.]|nr:GWxTD domain-containing protein [Candidatus Angelobacter sp.]
MKYSSAFQASLIIGIGAAVLTIAAQAPQGQAPAAASSSSSSSSNGETIAKPLTKKQIAKKQKALEKELAGPWKKWMSEDVTYIITDEERQAFKRLKTDEERQQF